MDPTRRLNLSPRERQLVQLAAEGHTDASIANELNISEATVSTYWGRVRSKVGPFSRPELIAKLIRNELNELVSSLRRENRQLIEELQKATGKEWGHSHENYYLKLVRDAPDAILIVNDRGDIETVNDECSSLFGYSQGELEGQSLLVLVPERYRSMHSQHRSEYMQNPTKRRMAEHSISVGVRKDQTEFQIAASLSPVDTASGIRVMCIIRKVG